MLVSLNIPIGFNAELLRGRVWGVLSTASCAVPVMARLLLPDGPETDPRGVLSTDAEAIVTA